MSKLFAVVSSAAVLVSGASTLAAPFIIPIDTAHSSITAKLCLLTTTNCGQDTSPATGYFQVDVDAVGNITSATLFDFNISLTQPLDLNVSFGILGHFNSTTSNFSLFDAAPGTPVGPVALAGTAFSFSPVPTLKTGILVYDATGIVCSTLQGQTPPVPCNGSADLANDPVTAGTYNGNLTSAGRVVTITSIINQSSPLDPANPSTGTLTVTGSVTGSLFVALPPCPADLSGDRVIGTADLTALLGNFGQSVPPGTLGDITGDGVVGTADLTTLLGVFGSSCADH